MKQQESYSVKLDNFEGPLEFLLYLVKKNELDIYDVRLRAIIDHFIAEMQDPKIDLAAEFIGTLASLLFLKSKMLLPNHDREESEEEGEEGLDPYFDVIHQLIDYSRFKEAGEALVVREREQHGFFSRGIGDVEVKKPLGIDHLSLDDLASLFQDILEKAEANRGSVEEESFRVADKIFFLRALLSRGERVTFYHLFPLDSCKEELIVIFLALLELMKLGEAFVYREEDELFVTSSATQGERDGQGN